MASQFTPSQIQEALHLISLYDTLMGFVIADEHAKAHDAYDALKTYALTTTAWNSFTDWNGDVLGPPERFADTDYTYLEGVFLPAVQHWEYAASDPQDNTLPPVVLPPATTVTLGQRPPEVDGCMSTWSEQQVSNVVRSAMEGQVVKVRRRTTGIMRNATVTLNADAKLLPAILNWFNIECQGGVLPTRITEPDRTDAIWRFKAPPQITWNTDKVVQLAFEIEQMPFWRGL